MRKRVSQSHKNGFARLRIGLVLDASRVHSAIMNAMPLTTNHELLSKLCCRNGNETDWHKFYSDYQQLIARWCRQSGVPTSDLEDTLHEVLIKLVTGLSQYDRSTGHRFRSWLKSVVLNTIIDALRKSKKYPMPKLLAQPELKSQLDSLADQLTERSTSAAEILNRVRLRLQPLTWDAFVRRELLQEEVSTIAGELGIKKASVYQSVSRVRTMIKEECQKYFQS